MSERKEVEVIANSIAATLKKYGFSGNIDAIKSASELFPIVPSGMTKYQIEQFVFSHNEFPTWYSVYYQAVLEVWSRFTAIHDTIRGIKIKDKQNKLKKAIIEKNYYIDNCDHYERNILRAKNSLMEQQIENAEEEIAILVYGMTSKVRELEIFENIRKIALKNVNGKMPDWGNDEEEMKKWFVKFITNGHEMRKSLISGDMERINFNDIIEKLNKDEIELLTKSKFTVQLEDKK